MNILSPKAYQPKNLGARQTTLDLIIQLCLFALTFAFSLAHPWSHAYVGEAQFGDAAYWDQAGESWARGYIATKYPDIRPGYSLFLGVVYSLSGVDFYHAFVAQALLLGIASLLVYQIGRQLGGRAAGVMAGLVLALNPYMNEWVALSTTEILGCVCNLGALYYLLRSVWRTYRTSDAVLFGILLGYANTVRPLTLLFLIPALPIILAFVNAPWKKRVWLTVGAAGGAALMLSAAVLYQYWSGGDAGISSNAAANFYGASNPRYRTWAPEMYAEVETELRSRGITPSETNMNAEFWRLTLRNYVQYPHFQLQRIGDGFGKYALFEGELERPGRYIFFRPFVAAGILLLTALALVIRKARPPWWLAIAAGLIGVVMLRPVAAFAAARGIAVFIGFRFLRRKPHPRQVTWGLLALYWVLVGFSQALVGGTEGFLLHRLYTQVEPVNALLIALGAFQLLLIGMPKNIATVRLLNLTTIDKRLGQIPKPVHQVSRIVRALVGVAIIIGLVRLIAINVAPPRPQVFTAPTASELNALRNQLELPTPIQYLGSPKSSGEALTMLTRTSLPEQVDAYAIPGQFSRFLWYMEDQARTEFWFYFADQLPPASIDRDRLWAEAGGRLDLATYRDEYGLLVLVPMNAYFMNSGDWKQLNMVQARAFVPWDAEHNQFAIEDAVIFPLSTLLVDPARLAGATVTGKAEAEGQVVFGQAGPILRTLKFRPSLPIDGGPNKESTITFPDLFVLPGAKFKSFVARSSQSIDLANASLVIIELWITSGEQDFMIATYTLDVASQIPIYVPFDADLSSYSGQQIKLTLRVIGSSETPKADEVLVGEPQIIVP